MAANERAEAGPELIDAIYGTIRAPQTWPEVLRAIGDWLDADIGMMLSPTLPGIAAIPMATYGLDMTAVLDRFPKHAGRAEFTHRALATGRTPGAFLLDELMSPDEQKTNAFWQDIIAPLDITSGIFCMARTPDDNLRPMLINYYRRAPKPAFTHRDVGALENLLPHLRRALGIILDSPPAPVAPAGMSEIYDAIGAACFFIGADGLVMHRNHAGDLLVDAGDGLRVCDRRVVLWEADAQVELDRALARVVGDRWSTKFRMGVELVAKRPSGGTPFVIVATPVGADNPISSWATPIRCVLFVLEEKLRCNGLLPERLQRLYGLTQAECDIAIGVASGVTLTKLSEQRGTRPDTVRTQAKKVFSKTGARKQSELAALVNRLRF